MIALFIKIVQVKTKIVMRIKIVFIAAFSMLLLIGGLNFSYPTIAKAQTVPELQAEVKELKAQIQQLLMTIAALQGQIADQNPPDADPGDIVYPDQDLAFRILSPNGKEKLRAGEEEIRWTMPTDQRYWVFWFLIPQGATPIKLPGNGSFYDERFGGYSMGGQSRTIPVYQNSTQMHIADDIPAGRYKLRMYLAEYDRRGLPDPDRYIAVDESDRAFRLIGSSSPQKEGHFIKVRRPNGGEVFAQGSRIKVRWKSSSSPSYVGLNLMQNGAVIQGRNVNNTGSFVWQLPPDLSGSGFKFRIYGEGVVDESNESFDVVAPDPASPDLDNGR